MSIRARTIEAKQQKRQKILDAAKELFFNKGYYVIGIDMITEKAGVSTGTFYHYYKNKIEIYKSLQNEGLDILVDSIMKVISLPRTSSLTKLKEIARVYFRYYNDHREYFDIISILSATPDELKETQTEISRIVDRKAHSLLKMIESVLIEGIENGEFVSMNTWKVTNMFWGLMDGLILLEHRNNTLNVIGVDLEDLIKQALEITFFGIVKHKPSENRKK
ncbi:MAG: TetR/AcrR family transcriptional regulator [Dehalococcoidia bacterium]|nr:TetR/AcrR family transcriptional regulator [Dehalococcoidia bacterium]